MTCSLGDGTICPNPASPTCFAAGVCERHCTCAKFKHLLSPATKYEQRMAREERDFDIVMRLATGDPVVELAERYGLSESSIWRINRNFIHRSMVR